MTKNLRHQKIVELVLQHGNIQVTELAKICNVSLVTIRKDLVELEKANKLYRNNGRAVIMNPYVNNKKVLDKENLYAAEKRLIGEYAANVVHSGDSIIIASGTTMHALARAIDPESVLTVLTSSLEVATILSEKPQIDIVQLGGLLRHSSLSVVGASAENALQDFLCNKLFIGVDGIDLNLGITTTDMMEAHLNRVMMDKAQKVIVLADSSKFGKFGFAKIADMKEINQIITDSRINPQLAHKIEAMGIELSIVHVPE